MKKTMLIITFLILAVIIGFFIGIYLNNDEDNKTADNIQNVIDNSADNDISIAEVQTSVTEDKISVNTEVIEEIYYTKCDHILKFKKNTNGLVNMTQKELENKYMGWEVKEFSTKKVVLFKVEEDYCHEHYLVKDEDGYVVIYGMNNDDEVNEIIKYTEIETKYLTETDQEDLKRGIKVYSEQKLNKLIEDFE